MSPELHQRVRRLFEEAIELPERQRLAFLKSAADDQETYDGVVRLLQARASAPSFLEDETRQIERMGRYLLTGELGRGAMGVVYEAIDPLIGRSVAVKIIHTKLLVDSEFMRDRLFREARAAGRLFHPGIVVILDVGQEGDVAFIAMERVEGPTLEKILASGQPLRFAEALDILRQTAAALDYAHHNGVVHRDVKPGNILLHKGTAVKVSDFGIAKSMSTQHGTVAGMILGTPSYMSPEQVEALPVDGRSDQFSLAVVAYELLGGNRPFQGDSLATLAHMIVYGLRPSIQATNPALPSGLDAVLHRGLARKPEQRYESCTDFVGALEEVLKPVLDTESAGPRPLVLPQPDPPTTESRPKLKKRRSKSLWYLAAAGAALIILDLALFYYRAAHTPSQPAHVAPRLTTTVVAAKPPEAKPPAEKSTAPVVKLNVDPALIESGTTATLRWDVTGATQVLIDHGIGKVAPAGNVEVSPQKPTAYVLTATGPGGSISAQAHIDVTSAHVTNQKLARELYNSGVDRRRAGQYSEAEDLFRRAADLGDARAMQEIGEMYMDGNGVEKDDEQAARWFRRAATHDNSAAMVLLGGLYMLGTGVEQSDTDAADWFRKAAAAENPEGIYNLGTLYENGTGVNEDLGLAKQLYQKAAKLGNQEAQKHLNQMNQGH